MDNKRLAAELHAMQLGLEEIASLKAENQRLREAQARDILTDNEIVAPKTRALAVILKALDTNPE